MARRLYPRPSYLIFEVACPRRVVQQKPRCTSGFLPASAAHSSRMRGLALCLACLLATMALAGAETQPAAEEGEFAPAPPHGSRTSQKPAAVT